jgi:hypothetical protein
MSSEYVRTEILDFLGDNSAENFIDITGTYDELDDLLTQSGITVNDPWVGIQFVGAEEVPITIDATNTKGKYRELGSVYIHTVDVASFGIHTSILSRAEALRNLLRGRRIGDIIVESVTPPNFEFGAALQFEGGYMSATFILNYERDFDL